MHHHEQLQVLFHDNLHIKLQDMQHDLHTPINENNTKFECNPILLKLLLIEFKI